MRILRSVQYSMKCAETSENNPGGPKASGLFFKVEKMSVEKVREYLRQYGLEDKILIESKLTATVAMAAEALGVSCARIAKTMAFHGKEEGSALLVVVSGDMKIANALFKQQFGIKASMLDSASLLALTGHMPGGVCPFALDGKKVSVYLDESIKRFTTVFPACGSADSCIELTLEQLELTSRSLGYVNVCKPAGIQ